MPRRRGLRVVLARSCCRSSRSTSCSRSTRSSPRSAWREDIEIMIAAVVIAMIVMYVASGPVARFIAQHPTTKMLALAFLVMIGVALVADGFEFHIPRGYIYSSMAFAGAVEVFNVLARRNRARKAARTRRQADDGRSISEQGSADHRRGRGIGAATAKLAARAGLRRRDQLSARRRRPPPTVVAAVQGRRAARPSRSRATWRARTTSRACSTTVDRRARAAHPPRLQRRHHRAAMRGSKRPTPR